MIAVSTLTCPICGAPLPHPGERPDRCPFCGAAVIIAETGQPITPGAIDQALIHKHIAEHRRQLQHDPSTADAYYGLGVAYYNLGLFDDAARELTQAIRLVPENAQTRVQLAIVLTDLAGQSQPRTSQRAWTEVEHALRLAPGLPDALLVKARLLTRQRRWRDALEMLDEVAIHHPDVAKSRRAWVHLARAEAELERQHWIGMLQAWREAARHDQESVRDPIGRFLTTHRAFAIAAITRHASVRDWAVPTARWWRLPAAAGLIGGLTAATVIWSASERGWLSGMTVGLLVTGLLLMTVLIGEAIRRVPVDPNVLAARKRADRAQRNMLAGQAIPVDILLTIAETTIQNLEARRRLLDARWRQSLPISLPSPPMDWSARWRQTGFLPGGGQRPRRGRRASWPVIATILVLAIIVLMARLFG